MSGKILDFVKNGECKMKYILIFLLLTTPAYASDSKKDALIESTIELQQAVSDSAPKFVVESLYRKYIAKSEMYLRSLSDKNPKKVKFIMCQTTFEIAYLKGNGDVMLEDCMKKL